jgi:chromosome segregation ATPase
MRIAVVAIATLLLLAACGGNEEKIAAKKSELSDIKKQLASLEQELARKREEWKPTKDAFFEASQALRAALLSGDTSASEAAQAAYDRTQEAERKVGALERGLLGRIQDLKDRKKAVLREIQGLGGGVLEP